MTDKSEKKLNDVPFRITDPERIPAKRYYDEQFFKLEQELLWPHVWQMACRLEQITEIGDYVEYRILDKSVIVVRTSSGVKAFHNACRHRGVELVSGHGNCKKQGFVCPFHGWRFNMDGESTFVFGKKIFSEKSLEQAELNLVPCRVELWGGCAFINFDDDAPSLLDRPAYQLEARDGGLPRGLPHDEDPPPAEYQFVRRVQPLRARCRRANAHAAGDGRGLYQCHHPLY